MSKEKYTIGYANAVIAKFMGYEYITVGYAGSEEETEWQRNNEEWMNKVGIENVGRYLVNVKEDEWYPFDDINYHIYWDQLMPVIEKIHTLKKRNPDGKDLCLMSQLTVYMELDGYFRRGRCSILGHITYCNTLSIPHTYERIDLPSIFVHNKDTLIEAAHEAVYQFITWYNQQPQTNEQ